MPPHAPGFAPIPGLTGQYGDFRGMFEALTDPKIIPAAQLTELGDDEEVLGLTVNGASRAYPARFIAWHHIVNDVLGGKPVAVTYCSVCNSGVAYDPVVDGKRRLFNVFGLYRGVMAMIDPSTETVWSHLAGEALLGPDKGKTLAALPVVNTTWGEWKRLHPDTTTPAWDARYRQYYSQKVVSGRDYLPPMFRPTLSGLRDDRLAPNALVLAVRVEGKARAYPVCGIGEGARMWCRRRSAARRSSPSTPRSRRRARRSTGGWTGGRWTSRASPVRPASSRTGRRIRSGRWKGAASAGRWPASSSRGSSRSRPSGTAGPPTSRKRRSTPRPLRPRLPWSCLLYQLPDLSCVTGAGTFSNAHRQGPCS